MAFQRSKNTGSSTSSATQTTEPNASVQVEIRGQKLTIRSEHDAAYVHALANYVDGKVAELQAAAPRAPIDKLLMLASMTVAEELFEARQQNDDLRRTVKSRIDAALAMVDEASADFE